MSTAEAIQASPLAGTDVAHDAKQHRAEFRAYVLEKASGWHRQHIGRLYHHWDEWNSMYFRGAMVPPYILITPPTSSKAIGDCAVISCFGGVSQIRIRPNVVEGKCRFLRPGPKYATGRRLFVADILLHEMVHQWHHEVTGDLETSYHGHGPAFTAECNRIGALLGLPPVRSSKKRGRDKDLPPCTSWPHNVRPESYYQGAYILEAPLDDGAEDPGADGKESEEDDRAKCIKALLEEIETLACLALSDLDDGKLEEVRESLEGILGAVRGDSQDGDGAMKEKSEPLTEREAAGIGPRMTKDTKSVPYAWQTVEWIKTLYQGKTLTQQRWERALEEAEKNRIFDLVPPEKPYGSLDALLKAEIGETAASCNRPH